MFTGGWDDKTPADTVELIKKMATNLTQELGQIAGLDHAAYFNEADPWVLIVVLGDPYWSCI
jgi:hypothetical protein